MASLSAVAMVWASFRKDLRQNCDPKESSIRCQIWPSQSSSLCHLGCCCFESSKLHPLPMRRLDQRLRCRWQLLEVASLNLLRSSSTARRSPVTSNRVGRLRRLLRARTQLPQRHRREQLSWYPGSSSATSDCQQYHLAKST